MDMKHSTIRLYNYLTHKKEVFLPLKKDLVSFYACGPTVYNYVHIGNLRTYVFEDVLRRVLEEDGYRVRHVMNITDIDDKTIRESKAAHMDLSTYTKRYEEAFFKDLATLAITPAWKYPRATEHVESMVTLISKLLKKKIAYISDGSVYFSISAFPSYGRLSRLAGRTLKTGARVDSDEYSKDMAEDFVLWKAKKEDEPSWPSPFGEGRPGWHIECSTMSAHYLGMPFDIHAGGVDLIFPHHENEIAQSEGAQGTQFVRFFVEGEHLLVEGAKMSKSLGNTYTLRDIETREFSPLDFRYLTLSAHYRTKLNFTWDSLESARCARSELMEFIRTLLIDSEGKKYSGGSRFPYSAWQKKFMDAAHDDLNIPKALGVLWSFIRAYYKAKTKHPKSAYTLFLGFDKVLGLSLLQVAIQTVPSNILHLLQERELLRKAQRWQEADKVRDSIEKEGWMVQDRSEGPTAKKSV